MPPKNKNITLLELLMGFFFLNKPALLLLQYTTTTRYNYYNYNIKKNSFTTTLDQKTTIVSPAAL